MKRLFNALGIDYAQWKALTLASLRIELRTGSLGGAATARRTTGAMHILAQIFMYGTMGVFVAIAIWTLDDRFLATTLFYTYAMLMVGIAMVADHNTAITSPRDYGVLGFQPVTSRTYFASRIANILVYTIALSSILGAPPIVAVFIKYGPAAGLAALLALHLCAATVTLAIIAGYAWVMQKVGPRRLQSILSWTQMAMGFIVYGGFFLGTRGLSKTALAGLSVDRTIWLALLPGTWFASWIELFSGSTLALDVLPALASIVALTWLASRLRGRLSLEYAQRIGELAAGQARGPASERALRPGLWFRGGEARAVALLVRGHFRSDIRFRMGVLAVVPLTLIYLVMGLRQASGQNEGSGVPDFTMVSIAALLFPIVLKANLAHSDSFRASWIFFSSPADRTRVIRSAKDVLVTFFLLPYLAFVGLILAFFTRDWVYVGTYLILLAALSNVALLVLTLLNPELPFAKPMGRTRGGGRLIGAMIVMSVLGSLLPMIARYIDANLLLTVIAFTVVAALTVGLRYLTRVRIERQARRLEFTG